MLADCLPHTNVTIRVNGQALHEYPCEIEEAMAAVSYVEAKQGTEFAVVVRLEQSFAYRSRDEQLQILLFIDGRHVRSSTSAPGWAQDGQTATLDGVIEYVDGRRICRKFTFAGLETSMYQDRP